MKLVTFARAMAPHGVGDTRLVPDKVAARLLAAGEVSAAETWPQPSGAVAKRPRRPILSVGRPAGVSDARIAR